MAKIRRITARPILDSRGTWTVEAALELADGTRAVASVPQGKSTGSHEAASLPADRAVKRIEADIAPKLKGMDVRDQAALDLTMREQDGTPNKNKLGANAILAVSIAALKAAAAAEGVPVHERVRALMGLPPGRLRRPRLYMNVVNGGLHAGNNLAFQEYMIIPKAATFHEAAEAGARIYHALGALLARRKGRGALNVGDEGGFAPDFGDDAEPFRLILRAADSLKLRKKIELGLDAAATDVDMTAALLRKTYLSFERKFPLIYLEDPFPEESFSDFAKLKDSLPEVRVTGDDLTTTNVRRMERAHAEGSVNAIIVKPNQIGSVTETLDAIRLARQYGWSVVVSHRSGETNDDFIADLAVGAGADGIKLGAPARGERIAKYNRLLAIERGG